MFVHYDRTVIIGPISQEIHLVQLLMASMRKKEKLWENNGRKWGRRENEDFGAKLGPNEDHFSSLVLMRTKSSIEDLYAATDWHKWILYQGTHGHLLDLTNYIFYKDISRGKIQGINIPSYALKLHGGQVTFQSGSRSVEDFGSTSPSPLILQPRHPWVEAVSCLRRQIWLVAYALLSHIR